MEISLLVLFLQIGFNAALKNRGNNGNPLTPSARFVNSAQTRRLPESDQSLSSASDSEQSDDEYSSFEDYSFRSVRPLQISPSQRRNDYLRYNSGPENDVSLESGSVGKINSNNYADSIQSSSSLSRRTDPNLKRPYLKYRPSNLRQGQTRKHYRKAKDDLSLEVSSLKSSNPEDAYHLGEEASYLPSRLSLIEEPNNRRGQNRKYYRKTNTLRPDVSPIDKLNPDEDAVNSLPSSPNRRRNYRKEYNNHPYDLRIREPSPVKDIHDANIDTILLVTDDDNPDEIPIERPKLGSPESTGLGNNNLYNRRHGDGLNLDDDISNNLLSFSGLKPRLRSRKLTNDSPLTRKFNRESDDNADLESSFNDELFPDDDKTGQLTLLPLASLEDLHLESPLLRSSDRKHHNNRINNRRNFVRLSLSPNNKLTLDEGVASDLSDLLLESLDKLELVPVTLRRTGSSNNKYSRRENKRLRAGEDNLSNVPVLRLGSVDIPNAELPLRRYHGLANRSNNRNLRKQGNNKEALKKLFDDIPVQNLVPYHEVKRNKFPNSRKNEKLNNNRRDDFPDEFNLGTLFKFRKEDYDHSLDIDDNVSSDLFFLRSNQDQLSLEPPLLRSSDENPSKSKDTDDTLDLEFPWNDPLSSNGDKGKSQLRSHKQKGNSKDTSDTLHIEFPWNDQLSPNKSKTGGLRSQAVLKKTKPKDSTKDTADILHFEFPWNDQLSSNKSKTTGLRLQAALGNTKPKDSTKDTTDILHLEFPWNDQLSSNKSKIGGLRSQAALRNTKPKDSTKNTTDILHLEFPWNDKLSPNKSKTDGLRSQAALKNTNQKDITEDTTDTLHLEFPWNDQLSPSKDKISNLSVLHKLKSQLRSSEEKDISKDTTDTLHLQFPSNDQLSSKGNKGKSQLRSHKQKDNTKDTTDTLHLEFPWYEQLSPSKDKTSNRSALRILKSRFRSHKQKDNTKNTTDTLHLEFPWNHELSFDENQTSELKSQSLLRSQSDRRQDKEPKDKLKLEFLWNDKPSPDKPSSKKAVLRTPDPFYVHPYLRNRNIRKHPNYFGRSYDEFSEGIRLKKLKDSPSELHFRHSNRRFNDNQSLAVVTLAREDLENDTVFRDTDEDPSAVITSPLDRLPERLRTQARGSPALVTTTERPNDTESILNHIGDNNDIITYNDTIVFPKN